MSNRAKTERGKNADAFNDISLNQKVNTVMRENEKRFFGKPKSREARKKEEEVRANVVEIPGQIIDAIPNLDASTPAKERK